MATLLDVGILDYFGSVFVVILLFAIIFGLLEATKPFGDGKRGLHGLIALFIGLLFTISQTASSMVKVMVPWFIVVMVFIFFVLLLFRMFGVTDSQFRNIIGDGSVYPWVIVLSIIVLLGALGAVFGQSFLDAGGGGSGTGNYTSANAGGFVPETTSTTTSNFSVNLMNTLRNPKIMGMVFILLTGTFLMVFLTKMPK